MKETLYTIPLMDAFKEKDECPFCFIERKLERDNLDYILGSASAYMQTDIREQTNKHGFCSEHYKKMFTYGNSLGNAIMMQSYLREVKKELHKQMKGFSSSKSGLLDKLKKDSSQTKTSLGSYLQKTTSDCLICQKNQETFARYIDTFFLMLRSDEEFYQIFKSAKGFCLHHLQILVEQAEQAMGAKQREEFHNILFPQMEAALERLDEDISWFIDKFDYKNKDADWKNSKDALQRCMQKLTTGYPADQPYQSSR